MIDSYARAELALDVIEALVVEHLDTVVDGTIVHAGIPANRAAVDLLADRRPHIWEKDGDCGIRRVHTDATVDVHV